MATDETTAAVTALPSAVGELLEERETVRTWLERLEQQQEEVSPEVYQEVAKDYRKRLIEVETELAEKRSELEAALHKVNDRQDELAASLEEARRDRDEAKLRHRVGEFDEEEWAERQETYESRIEELEKELERASEAASDLETVVSVVADAATEAPGDAGEGDEVEAADEPAGTEEGTTASGSGTEEPRDELEFLESMDDSLDLELDSWEAEGRGEQEPDEEDDDREGWGG